MSKLNTSSPYNVGPRSKTPNKVTITQLDLDAVSNSTNSKLSSTRRDLIHDFDINPIEIDAKSAHLSDEVKRLTSMNSVLEQQIQTLKNGPKNLDRERELEHKFSLLLGENERLNNVIQNFKKLQLQTVKQEEFLGQLKDLREKFSTSEKVIKSLTDQLSQIKAENSKLKSDYNMKEYEADQYRTKCESIAKEKAQLEETNERLRTSIKEVQESLHKQFVELKDAIQQDPSKIPSADVHAACIEQNLKTLTDELGEGSRDEGHPNDSYTYVLYAKLEELDIARRQIKQLQEENDHLRHALHRNAEEPRDNLSSHVQFLNSSFQVSDAREELKRNEEIIKENDTLKSSLKVMLETAEELKSRCLAYEDRIQGMTNHGQELQNLRDEIQKSDAERIVLITKLQQALQEKKVLHDSLMASTTNLPRQETPKPKAKPTHKRSESSTQPNKNLELETENQLLKSRIVILLEENQKLNLALNHKIKQSGIPFQLEEKIAKLEEERDALKSQNTKVLKDNERMNIKIQDKEEELMLMKAKTQQSARQNRSVTPVSKRTENAQIAFPSPIEKMLDCKSTHGDAGTINSARSNQVLTSPTNPLSQIMNFENKTKPVVQINLPIKSDKTYSIKAPMSPQVKMENPRLESIKSPGNSYGLLNDNPMLSNFNPPVGDNYDLSSVTSEETYRLRKTLIDLIHGNTSTYQITYDNRESKSARSNEFAYN
jgi:chromosome segregation ATPase